MAVIYENWSVPTGPTGKGRIYQTSRRWGGSDPLHVRVNDYQRETEQGYLGEIYYPFGGNIACPNPITKVIEVSEPALASAVAGLQEKWTQSSLNVGVTIGEGRESAQMIIERLRQINRAVTALRKGSVGDAIKNLLLVPPREHRRRANRSMKRYLQDQNRSVNKLLDIWMELRYGWIPMLSDIYAAADLIKPKPVKTHVASGKTQSRSDPIDYQSVGTRIKGTGHSVKSVHAYATAIQSPSWVDRMGLTDPTIFWELTSKSFVIDWFIPIGDTIQANYVRRTLPVVNRGRTRFFVKKATCTGTTVFANPKPPASASANVKVIWMQRLPGFGNILDDLEGLTSKMKTQPVHDRDLKRIVDLTAMFRNQFQRK